MKITPILYVDAIEPSLAFWQHKLGFGKTVAVPEGDRLGFVILEKGKAELMLQTRASLENDMPALLEFARPAACLFIEVDDFAHMLMRLDGVEVVVPVRTTFYGMQEIVVREPGGNLVCLAAPVSEAA